MDGNRNWAGWIALGLAGLALLVALSGRMDAAFNLSWQVGAAARPGNITAQPQPAPALPAPPAAAQPAPVQPALPALPVKPDMPQPPELPKIMQPPFKVAPGYNGPFEIHGMSLRDRMHTAFGAGFRLLAGLFQLVLFVVILGVILGVPAALAAERALRRPLWPRPAGPAGRLLSRPAAGAAARPAAGAARRAAARRRLIPPWSAARSSWSTTSRASSPSSAIIWTGPASAC